MLFQEFLKINKKQKKERYMLITSEVYFEKTYCRYYRGFYGRARDHAGVLSGGWRSHVFERCLWPPPRAERGIYTA